MTKLGYKAACRLVWLLMACLCLSGCTAPLEQEVRTVKVAPISEEYKLVKTLTGKAYVLLAETSTGQEQHRHAVSDSLARTMKESKRGSRSSSLLNLASKSNKSGVYDRSLEVLSFADFANHLNENGVAQRVTEIMDFYQENGMFRKSDLQFLEKETGANYLIVPCLINIRRWATGRFSIAGVKVAHTEVVSGVVRMEIWDVGTGHRVFGATSDVTIAGERITEEPISIEEALERAWLGIIQELPKSSESDPLMVTAATGPQPPRPNQPGEESVD